MSVSHLPQTVELESKFRSAFDIKSGDILCDDPFSRHIGGSCSALYLNRTSMHCEFCLLVVSRAVFHSLTVKDKASVTATNGADPVALFHSVCTMAFPVERRGCRFRAHQ